MQGPSYTGPGNGQLTAEPDARCFLCVHGEWHRLTDHVEIVAAAVRAESEQGV